MKTNIKKFLAVLLTVCMLFSVLTVSLTAQATTLTGSLTLDTRVSASGTVYYSFTAPKTATYIFSSEYDETYTDTVGYLYSDPDFLVLLTNNDDGGDSSNFKFSYQLTAGVTYYLLARPYDQEATFSYYIKVTEAPSVSKIEFAKCTLDVIEADTAMGYWDTYIDSYGNEKKWFCYNTYWIVYNSQYKVTYSNGTTETIYGYDSDLTYSDTQSYSKKWKVGGTNKVKVTYFGKSVSYSVDIKETNIKSLKVVDEGSFKYLENNEGNGNWQADYNKQKFWFEYSPIYAVSAATIKVTYKNGKSEYIDFDNYMLSSADITTKQDVDTQWSIGGKKNTITINIQGVKTTINAKIKKDTTDKDFKWQFDVYSKTASLEEYIGSKKTGVEIPEKVNGYEVTEIQSDAFYGTNFYKNKSNWKDGALYIGDWLIKVNTSDTKFTVKSGTKHIASYAFSDCEKLQKLTLPSSIETIGYNYFSVLEKITFKGSPEKWSNISSYIWSYLGSYECNVTGSACSHDWKWVTDKKATKYINGSKHKECSKCGTYKSNSAKETISMEKATISGIKNKTYTGKSLTQSLTVKVGKTTLKKDTDYTVTYKNNKKVGTATVTIKGKGSYTGTVSKTFKITPVKTTVKKITAASKSLKIKITKKSTQVTGYQIQYSTSKTFKAKYTKTKTVKSYKTTSVTLKSLKAKKTYYVRVRTYKTVDGKKYYSAWSSYKTKKTK